VKLFLKRLGEADSHLPTDSKENIVKEKERSRSSTEFGSIFRVIGLGKQSCDKDIADTLASCSQHHHFASSGSLDEDKARE
jgi:hypothetical protein